MTLLIEKTFDNFLHLKVVTNIMMVKTKLYFLMYSIGIRVYKPNYISTWITYKDHGQNKNIIVLFLDPSLRDIKPYLPWTYCHQWMNQTKLWSLQTHFRCALRIIPSLEFSFDSFSACFRRRNFCQAKHKRRMHE